MKPNRSAKVTFLVVAQLLLVCIFAGEWLLTTTHRFYLEDRTDNSKQGTAWQHFVVEKDHVVPQIVTRNDARILFEINSFRSSVLHFRVNSIRHGAYEIYQVRNGTRRLLLNGDLSERQSETTSETRSGSVSLPAGRQTLEIDNHGAITWYDLRAVTRFHPVPYLTALIVLFSVRLVMSSRNPVPRALVRVSLMLASILLTIAVAELGLFLLSAKLPYSIAEHRRDLGVFRLDPRWELSSRYRKRMRPNSDTYTQWEYGDLVEMAIIPSEVSQARVNHYPVRTDREGFRNPATRERIAIAALGDSFTDALMLPVEQAWPARLEQILKIPVQNYGIAGFGPQQELYVLQDYVIQHRPSVVVVAYFAGNDIFDAQSFAKFEQTRTEGAEMAGWKIKKVVMRYEILYSVALLRTAFHGLLRRGKAAEPPPNQLIRDTIKVAAAKPAVSTAPPRAYFDRGMFHIPIHGHTVSFALMPPYLRTLTYSKADLEALPGWKLTRRAYQDMKRAVDQEGARLVVMYIPFKSQLYLPFLEQSFSTDDLNRTFTFYFRENPSDADVKKMSRNRLVQNEMMRNLCEEMGILFLDLTPALQRQIDQGNSVYFSDDAHWNSDGHELAARELADFLRQHHLDRAP